MGGDDSRRLSASRTRGQTTKSIIEQPVHLAVKGEEWIFSEAPLGDPSRKERGQWVARHGYPPPACPAARLIRAKVGLFGRSQHA
jgi:hypothetical protein